MRLVQLFSFLLPIIHGRQPDANNKENNTGFPATAPPERLFPVPCSRSELIAFVSIN